MRHYIRDKSGSCYAFTLCLANRQHAYLTDYVDEFRHAYRLTKTRHPFILHALVLLPDHLHILITLEHNTDYSRLIAHLKSQFSRQLPKQEVINASRQAKGERGIWQRRFWEHKIRNQTDFNNHMDYIHYNPVKHGYVQRVADWQYSSFHRWVAQGYYATDWGSNMDLSSTLDLGE